MAAVDHNHHTAQKKKVYIWSDHILAGAISGGLTRFTIAPLDVLKIRFQVQVDSAVAAKSLAHNFHGHSYHSMWDAFKRIVREEGIKGLWRGNLLAEYLWITYTSLQFSTYEAYTRLYHRLFKKENDHGPLASLICGGLGGLTSSVVSYPLDLLRTRFACQTNPPIYKSISEAYRKILHSEGIRGFYKGMSPSLAQIVPTTAIQFATYNKLKTLFAHEGIMQQMLSGGIAGLAGKLAVLPLDVLKKRLQIHGLKPDHKPPVEAKVVHMTRHIIQTEGLRAFYKGTAPSIVKAIAQTALGFTLYEQIKYAFEHWKK